MALNYLIFRYIKENLYSFTFAVLIFICGIIFGSIMVNRLPSQHSEGLKQEINFYFEVLDEATGINKISILKESLVSNGKFILVAFLSGLTVIGIPVIILILFIRGIILGFTVGFIFNHSTLKGLLFALSAIVPHNLLIIPALLVSSVASISFSWVILLKIVKNKNFNIKSFFLNYCILILLSGIFMVIAGVIEAYIIPILLKLVVSMMI
ncbi:stage II sporulation protein M [Anaerobranca californiensis DSM 14826]|uniref:Stage II sporulation protein M n=1 Tax=Anaerobranca californiensis DSM 14826 TaxID=1120989 RepID=A0A1M6L417_9FIRM|nr:stage II sporulation protein M [Anaerobranca californiensis]SHJ65957.1 stage II sporulation protein M [Anaerobranca californiensis DSM 14826]